MKKSYEIIIRYSLLLLLAIVGFGIFYKLFSSLTVGMTFSLLDLFYDVKLVGNIIVIDNLPIEIIGACIAGSAYAFLLILNLSVPIKGIWKRIGMIVFAFGVFFLINILRIFFLSIMYISSSPYFDFTHKLFWYLGSTIFVIGIWFLEVKLFNIKEIPFYTDLKHLYSKSSFKKRKKIKKTNKAK